MASLLSTKKDRDWALAGILVIAFLFRFLYLGEKPPHFDEGINGWFVDQLISNGYYSYDPTNYHGPLHFYILWVFKFFFGRNLWALRLSSSCFGIAGVWMIARLKTYLGTWTAYGAALLSAVSPGIIFYTRYAIHESELFFFSLLALHGFLRFQTKKDKISIWLLGLGLVGMVLTKETFIVHLGCFAVAWGCLKVYEMISHSIEPVLYIRPQFTNDDLAIVTGVCVLIFTMFYSGFFLHPQGIGDFFRSFQAWYGTGQKGNGHQKPFWYWLTLFQHYEIVALAGFIFVIRLLYPSSRWFRLIGIYGFGVWCAYSIVAYKTPWCVMNIVWPFYIIAAGLIAEALRRFKKSTAWAVAVFIAVSLPAAAQSVRLNFYHYDDEAEPYVYVQTFSDIMDIYKKLISLVEKDPSLYHISIKIFMESNWPLPWLLGDFTKVGYYGSFNTQDPNGDLILTDEKNRAIIESRLTRPYFKKSFRLRSAQEAAIAYFDATTFKNEFPAGANLLMPKILEELRPGAGLLAEYYPNPTWTGVPVMKKITSAPGLNLTDSQRPLPAPFGILFSGEIFIPETGRRTFFISSDDGSDLYIDGAKIIDNQGAHADQMRSADAVLKKGWHKMAIHYNDFGGGMLLRLWWSDSRGTQGDIPPEDFRVKDVSGGKSP